MISVTARICAPRCSIGPSSRNKPRASQTQPLDCNIYSTCANTKNNQPEMPGLSTISAATQKLVQRTALACVIAATLATSSPVPAFAADVEPIYMGNGCFWGRQYDFVNLEQKVLGRSPEEVSAIVGYAAGKMKSPSDKVCYYYTTDKNSVYEHLGHAEVVQLELRGDDKEAQFRKMADTYFSQFRRLPNGKMIRQDPQDAGPGYRNVIGIPGGVSSPLFKILQEANINNMELREGQGGAYGPDNRPMEDDVLNLVWVVDSNKLPFYRAEVYHQFHDGLGKKFPDTYKKSLKQKALETGLIAENTGCPEYFFLGS